MDCHAAEWRRFRRLTTARSRDLMTYSSTCRPRHNRWCAGQSFLITRLYLRHFLLPGKGSDALVKPGVLSDQFPDPGEAERQGGKGDDDGRFDQILEDRLAERRRAVGCQAVDDERSLKQGEAQELVADPEQEAIG